MSYDLQVWTTDCPSFASALGNDSSGWQLGREHMTFAGGNWQVVVSGPHLVEAEDVPDGVADVVIGVRHLTEINVEPIGAPIKALKLARRVARAIAQQAHGVVFDPQDDSVTTPTGFKRFSPTRHTDRFSIIDMTWWFTEGPLLSEAGLRAFLDVLGRYLPEALPKRYGEYEPPKFRLDVNGLDHFVTFLREHVEDSIVWYPTRPVVGVSFYTVRNWGVGRRGFKCSYVSIECDASALRQPGWQNGVQEFWRRASRAIRPFYGDVRTLHGYIPSRSTYSVDTLSESHPVRGPSWRGIPRDPGHACVCGPDYLAAWAGLAAHATMQDGLAFFSRSRWDQEERVAEVVGTVPEQISQRRTPTWTEFRGGGKYMNWNTEYPEFWPFGERPPSDPPLV